MKYPAFRNLGNTSSSTPSDQLLICDHCQIGQWTMRLHGHVTHHTCTDYITVKYKGKEIKQHKGRRMREATQQEYADANRTLVEGYKRRGNS